MLFGLDGMSAELLAQDNGLAHDDVDSQQGRGGARGALLGKDRSSSHAEKDCLDFYLTTLRRHTVLSDGHNCVRSIPDVLYMLYLEGTFRCHHRLTVVESSHTTPTYPPGLAQRNRDKTEFGSTEA